MTLITHNESDTTALAMRLSSMLSVGDTVLLSGDLGAGKSVLARGIARGMGIDGAMPSPTFTLMIPYESGGKKLYHFDLYRISDPDEFWAAGLDEYVGGDGVAVIEWPDVAGIAPEPSLTVRMARLGGEDERRVEIENRGVEGFDPSALDKWRAADGE